MALSRVAPVPDDVALDLGGAAFDGIRLRAQPTPGCSAFCGRESVAAPAEPPAAQDGHHQVVAAHVLLGAVELEHGRQEIRRLGTGRLLERAAYRELIRPIIDMLADDAVADGRVGDPAVQLTAIFLGPLVDGPGLLLRSAASANGAAPVLQQPLADRPSLTGFADQVSPRHAYAVEEGLAGPRAGFAISLAPADVATRDRRQMFVALRIGAEFHDRGPDHGQTVAGQRGGRIDALHLLVEDHALGIRQTAAAIGLGPGGSRPAALGHAVQPQLGVGIDVHGLAPARRMAPQSAAQTVGTVRLQPVPRLCAKTHGFLP